MPFASISGRIDTRCAIECIYLKTCIISKTIHVVMVIDILGLLQGILFECLSCLWDIHIATYLLQ